MSAPRKTFSNGEVTIVWQAALCIHSEKCFHGLPGVFDPKKRPWIDASGASSEELVAQVRHCPSGALSIESTTPELAATATGLRIAILPDGPLLITGELTLVGADGAEDRRSGSTAFCRCGGSKNKPFCDGTHASIRFKG